MEMPCLRRTQYHRLGSEVGEKTAIASILRLACDLPTIGSVLETLCILFSSAPSTQGKNKQHLVEIDPCDEKLIDAI